jgi:hypothetical protein
MVKPNSLPSAGHYNANYESFQSELYTQIRREAFGEDIGQNSWLTANEQDRFLEWLDLIQGRPCSMLHVERGARLCGSLSGVANASCEMNRASFE